MTAVDEANSSLAIKCLDFCQALTSQGLEINFSLNIGSTFSFSLDTRYKVPLALDSKKKKKASPSTLRRNARRRQDFLKKNVVLQLWLPFLLPQPTIQSLPPTPPGIVIPQPTTMKIRSMLSSHLELAGSHFSPSSHRRWKFHPTMFPVHLFVQPVEVVGIGSFQELTPSVRGTI